MKNKKRYYQESIIQKERKIFILSKKKTQMQKQDKYNDIESFLNAL